MTFMGFCGVIMPSNYVASGVMLKTEAAKKVIEEALPVIKSIAKKIKNGNVICKTDKTRMAGIMSGPVNSLFNKYSSNCGYIVSDKCISCGKCADNCVLNNINMENGRPVFGKNCISCYACIHHCPVEAINIKGKTETHGRYVCPEYKK
jgi:ferredoxin